jgi:hypothetical protein
LPTPQTSTAEWESAPGTSYAYKASLVGGAHRFELTDEGLSWRVGRKSALWPYADIAAIRLSYRPVSMQSRRFRIDIETRQRQRLGILSTTWRTASLMAPQDADYRAFVTELHRRLATTGAAVALTGGLRPGIYLASRVALLFVALGMAALLVRAVFTAQWGGVLFIIGFGALFAWQTGGFVRRNKPRIYTFDALPQDLLP